MAKKVPPFHLRTIPAAIFDELWVLNPTTNEYEKLSSYGEGITVDWDDVSNKPAMTQDVADAGTSTEANTINALVLKTTIDNALVPIIARIEALEVDEPEPDV